MTEYCVSDIGIPNGESFNIAITRMLVVKSIFIYPYEENYLGCILDWQNLRWPTFKITKLYWVKMTSDPVVNTVAVAKLRFSS